MNDVVLTMDLYYGAPTKISYAQEPSTRALFLSTCYSGSCRCLSGSKGA